MEPSIKSEPCEALFNEQESFSQFDGGIQEDNGGQFENLQSQQNLKRVYKDVENSLPDRPNRNYAKNSYLQVDFPNLALDLQESCHNNDNLMIEPYHSVTISDGRPLKKYKRLEDNLLFNPPFFKLAEELYSPSSRDAMAACCYSCRKIVKGNKGISSNFIKHMKRVHPEVMKIYEDFKAHKMKTGNLPPAAHLLKAQMINGKSASNAENCASGSDSNATYSNDETNQFLEINDKESADILESSDDNEDPLNATKDSNHTNENLKELQNLRNATNDSKTKPLEFSAKTLETFGSIIDEKLKHFVKQKEYNQLKEKINILIKSNSPSNDISTSPAITELKSELDGLKNECAVLRLAVQQSQASKRQLQNELQTVDKLLHQRKLVIRNIQICNPDQPIISVEKLFREKLDLHDIKIVNCCILPSVKTFSSTSKECLSVELESPVACKEIFRQTYKLKNTGIFIESEISPFQRKRKNKLMVLRKELLRRKPDLKVLVRDCSLVVNGKNFYWDDVEGLCHDCKGETIELNGIEYLNLISGLDLKEFVNISKNYNIQIN